MKYIKKFESSDWEERRKKREQEINKNIPAEDTEYTKTDREDLRKKREEIINQELIDATIKQEEEVNREALRKRREQELVKKFNR
jgi:hypothetical protein